MAAAVEMDGRNGKIDDGVIRLRDGTRLKLSLKKVIGAATRLHLGTYTGCSTNVAESSKVVARACSFH